MTTWFQEIRKTLKIGLPITLGFIGQHLFGMVDTMFVGRHSTVELAAAAFVNSVTNIPLVFIYGLSSCIAVLVSQSRGRNDGAQAGSFLRHGLVILTAWAVVLIIGLELLTAHLDIFRQPPEVLDASKNFMRLMSLSILPLGVFMAFRQFSDGLERTMPAAVMMAVGFVINTFLCWLLIFGNWGAPELGLTGAGIATLTARIVMCVLMIGYVLKNRFYKDFLHGFHGRVLNYDIIKRCLNIGYPSGVQYLFEVGVFAGSAVLMGWLGTQSLAAHQIVINMASVTFMLPLSLSIATSIRIGQAVGRNDWENVRVIGWSTTVFVLGLMTFTASFFLFGRHIIPHWFTTDAAVIVLASEIFLLAAFFQFFDGVQAVLVGALRGASDVKVPTILLFIAYWVIGLTVAYNLAFNTPLKHMGLWSGLALSLIAASIFLAARFRWLLKRKMT